MALTDRASIRRWPLLSPERVQHPTRQLRDFVPGHHRCPECQKSVAEATAGRIMSLQDRGCTSANNSMHLFRQRWCWGDSRDPPLTLSPLPLKSNAVQPSISRGGPKSRRRLFGSTSTAMNRSRRSAPSLCCGDGVQQGSRHRGWEVLTFKTASSRISIPCDLAVSMQLRNSSFVPQRVAIDPFWLNSPKSHCGWCTSAHAQKPRPDRSIIETAHSIYWCQL